MAKALRPWLLAARPQTLWAALAPNLVGSALALAEHHFVLEVALLALLGATAIQVATNLFNDWADFARGADTPARVGPIRVTQQGLVPARQVLIASGVMALVAIGAGVGLIPYGGWPLVGVGISSLMAGAAYTGGPWPLAYVGLGDVFAFFFFGPVAVVTTVYLHGAPLSAAAWTLGAAEGLFATAILALNNLRDRATDEVAHKRTLAVRLGADFARLEHAAATLVPFVLVMALALAERRDVALLLPLALVPQAVALVRQVRAAFGAALNPLLGQTARLQAAYSVLVAVGLNTKV